MENEGLESREQLLASALIWVVDDEPTIVNLAKRILESEKFGGYKQVAIFSDSQEALEKFAKASQENKVPDLVISDWKMPGLKGDEMYQEMQKAAITSGRQVPVFLLMTGYSEDIEAEVLERAGISQVVAKPFTPVQIREIVKQALQRHFASL